ncbi:zinc-ribbon domain-containing protein [Brevibacillus ruminantium]|uniref:Zinc-ribbon domain-containing protein n=1 Tax=Brevibacillus ruminantium TaxID=2950604 RepID=A0ABY4WG64_9BACL|nr:zinc-ribbon domain-containing protein [Brevibacillus ruminantium]USG64825.1 zinc-ribbon domain-containing protein [Brevibacillus ruminantium]
MKSIKPGRGPSAVGAAGSLAMVAFGIFWTIMAFAMTRDAPFPLVGTIFPLFGIIFVGIGIFQAIYHYKNATSKERMSLFDITDSREEGDPLNRLYGKQIVDEIVDETEEKESGGEKAFCPYCGERVKKEYQYCSSCGKKL